MIKEGRKAPAFTLPSTEGRKISLKDYLGQAVVLYDDDRVLGGGWIASSENP